LSSEAPPWFPPTPTFPISRPDGEPPTWNEYYDQPTGKHDILLTTRYFLPPPPIGTYWCNNSLYSANEYENGIDTNLPDSPTDNTENTPTPTDAITKHKSKQTTDKCGVHTIISQNIHGITNGDDSKIKSLIQQMKLHKWAAVCIQETWQLGSTTYYIDDYKIIMHGHTTNSVSPENHRAGRNKAGVCIILNPLFAEAHRRAKENTVTLPTDHKFEGHFLGVPLTFPNYDNYGKRLKGNLHLFLCSIYHPHESNDHSEFNNILPSIINDAPKHSQLIFGHDINCNVGTCTDPQDGLRRTLGPFGLKKRNS